MSGFQTGMPYAQGTGAAGDAQEMGTLGATSPATTLKVLNVLRDSLALGTHVAGRLPGLVARGVVARLGGLQPQLHALHRL